MVSPAESIMIFIYMNLNDYFCLSLMFYTYSYTYIELFVISTEFFIYNSLHVLEVHTSDRC